MLQTIVIAKVLSIAITVARIFAVRVHFVVTSNPDNLFSRHSTRYIKYPPKLLLN